METLRSIYPLMLTHFKNTVEKNLLLIDVKREASHFYPRELFSSAGILH